MQRIPGTARRGSEELTPGSTAYLAAKAQGDKSMPSKPVLPEDVYGTDRQDPRDMAKAELPEPQSPAMQSDIPRSPRLVGGAAVIERGALDRSKLPTGGRWTTSPLKETDEAPTSRSFVRCIGNAGSPTGREPQGDGASVVVRAGESPAHGEGRQVSSADQDQEVREMRNAETILAAIRERGRRGLPLERVYRLLFNRELYLRAYGKIARNRGALTPGATTETVDGMSLAKIDAIIEALRFERYRWTPVRRVYIEKKGSTKKRPLGLPTWSDKLLQEVIRMLLEAYFEPQFSDTSHGFRPQRGCHTALGYINRVWRGVAWFIEGDISQCFDRLDHNVLMSTLRE